MTMTFNDVEQLRIKATQDIQRADKVVRDTCNLAVGRLQLSGVPDYTLKRLKAELKNFNSHTGCWKDCG